MDIKISDSFVAKSIKSSTTTGAGEAKLYIGKRSDEANLDLYFNAFSNITCTFDPVNLLEHIDRMLLILPNIAKVRKARDELKTYYTNLKTDIGTLTSFTFLLEKYTDIERYYIRPPDIDTDGKRIWREFFRKIPIPKYSQLRIDKDGTNYTFILEPLSVLTVAPLSDNIPRNKIIYGAPGTGKSYMIQNDATLYFSPGTTERINFYNGYTYGQFVGTYKPIPVYRDTGAAFKYRELGSFTRNASSEPYVVYEYTAGIFLKILINAIKDQESAFCLIIEEINRSKVDAVFGDMFQLLDRDSNGRSEYRVKCSDEMLHHIQTKSLDTDVFDDIAMNGIYIPKNLYLWATMNSADQGVFPMDTAFKRRWDFEYVGLNDSELEMGDYKINFKDVSIVKKKWNNFRRTINKILGTKFSISEDKLLAPFFVKKSDFDENDILEPNIFINKIIMYIKEDVLRHRAEEEIFIEQQFSDIVDDYKNGNPIFKPSFIAELNS